MILFKQAKTLTSYITQQKLAGKTIGFVPTMGALHHGHLSLLSEAATKADITICSIFVNPTQFNNPDDFKKYPNTIEQDLEKLLSAGCDLVFLPSVDEIYPTQYQAPCYDLGILENVLEGKYRPGHFQGVCQVVDRLLQITDPNYLLLGQKDFQQCLVVGRLLQLTNRQEVVLVITPTIRENDGLAMSSRNLRLTPQQREVAPALYKALVKAKTNAHIRSYHEITMEARLELSEKGFRVDYFEVVSRATLLPATNTTGPVIALVAAYLDDVRLIDNLPLN